MAASSFGSKIGNFLTNTKSFDNGPEAVTTTKGFLWKTSKTTGKDGNILETGKQAPSLSRQGIGIKTSTLTPNYNLFGDAKKVSSTYYGLTGITQKTKDTEGLADGLRAVDKSQTFAKYRSSEPPEFQKGSSALVDARGNLIQRDKVDSNGVQKTLLYDQNGKNPRVAYEGPQVGIKDIYKGTPYENLPSSASNNRNWKKIGLIGTGSTLAAGAVGGGIYGIVAATQNNGTSGSPGASGTEGSGSQGSGVQDASTTTGTDTTLAGASGSSGTYASSGSADSSGYAMM